jgi:hypothetical protein
MAMNHNSWGRMIVTAGISVAFTVLVSGAVTYLTLWQRVTLNEERLRHVMDTQEDNLKRLNVWEQRWNELVSRNEVTGERLRAIERELYQERTR